MWMDSMDERVDRTDLALDGRRLLELASGVEHVGGQTRVLEPRHGERGRRCEDLMNGCTRLGIIHSGFICPVGGGRTA